MAEESEIPEEPSQESLASEENSQVTFHTGVIIDPLGIVFETPTTGNRSTGTGIMQPTHPTMAPPSGNNRPVFDIVIPRVGGVLSDNQNRPVEAWTGGSNLVGRGMPRDIMCRRPTDFKASLAVSEACTKGLPDPWKLGAQDEESVMQLTSWLEVLEKKIASTGMDTPFHIVVDKEKRLDQQRLPLLERKGTTEIYVLKQWAMIGGVNIQEWEDILTCAGCIYDLQNLERSGEFIIRSLTKKFSEDVTSVIGMNPSGPRVLQEIISIKQQLDSSGARALENKLQAFQLKDLSLIHI